MKYSFRPQPDIKKDRGNAFRKITKEKFVIQTAESEFERWILRKAEFKTHTQLYKLTLLSSLMNSSRMFKFIFSLSLNKLYTPQ